MFGVAPGQLAPHLGIEAFPEPGQIGGHLYRPAVGSEQMDDHRNTVDTGSLGDAEKILEARFDPWWLAWLVMNGDLPAGRQPEPVGRGLSQTGRPKRGQQTGGS